MAVLGAIVFYTPSEGQFASHRDAPYAAIVGHVHEDGAADLYVMAPGQTSFWAQGVVEGTDPNTYAATPPGDPAPARTGKPRL